MKSRCRASHKTTEDASPSTSMLLKDGRWAGQCPDCGRWVVLRRRQTMDGLRVSWPAHSSLVPNDCVDSV